MSFNELELKRIDRTVGELCRRKTRPEYADQLRFECEIDGHTVSIWEVRPPVGRCGRLDPHGRRPLPLLPLTRRVAALLDAPRPQVAPL